VGQAEPPVTCSIGAVVVRAMPRDHQELVRRADALMYRVKRGGRNGIEIETIG
jgi:GGDEF domain-containing protein